MGTEENKPQEQTSSPEGGEQPLPQEPPKPDEPQKSQPEKEKKNRKKWWMLLILLMFLLAAGAGVYFWLHKSKSEQKNSAVKEVGFAGPLTSTAPQVDEDYKQVRAIGTNGGIIMAESRSGTLYTLVIPADAMLIPKTITLAPLKSSAIANYEADSDPGVFIGPDGTGGLFNRPAYLIIQPHTKRPTTGSIDQYGPCNTASRFFDPQWCAAINKTEFGWGVEADKAVTVSRYELKSVIASPTIPTGKSYYVAATTHGGSFAAAKINGTKAVQLAQATFGKRSGADDENNAEALAHVAAFGQDLTQFDDGIQWFTKAKRDYPRDLLKEIAVADLAGETDIVQNRVDQFSYIMNKHSANVETSFLPTVDYQTLLEQLYYELNGSTAAAAPHSSVKLAAANSNSGSTSNKQPANKTPAKKDPGKKEPPKSGAAPAIKELAPDIPHKAPYFEQRIKDAPPCYIAATMEMAFPYRDYMDQTVLKEALWRAFRECPQQEKRITDVAAAYMFSEIQNQMIQDQHKKKQSMNTPACNSDSLVHKQGLSDYGMNECDGEEPAQATV